MDKNTVIGLVLIGAVFIGFGVYNNKQAEKYNEARKTERDSLAKVEAEQMLAAQQEAKRTADSTATIQADSTTAPSNIYYSAALNTAASASQDFYTIENELLKLTLTNKGGRVYSAELKEYKTYDQLPLILLNGEENNFAINFFTNQQLSTSAFAFTPASTETKVVVSESDTLKQLSLRLYVDSVSYIEYVYGMRPNSYMVDMNVNMVGMNKHIAKNATTLDLTWNQNAPQQEKGFTNENNNTTIAYRFPNSDVEQLNGAAEEKAESVKTKVEWIAFKQQFFSTILLSKEPFLGAELKSKAYPEGNPNHLVKNFSATMQLPYNGNAETQSYPLSIYFGPNGYKMLKSFDHEFEQLVPLGGWVFGWVNRWLIIPVFDFLKKFISNFGLIIFILTILIKLITYPLTQKSYISSAKMKVLKPEVDKIAAKYPKKEDALKKQQETMALYKRTGVSMMGGCIPMLLQLPILIAMYRFFPASIELRQQGFLWADDLSSYDAIVNLPFTIPFYGSHISLFTLLMAVTMFITTKTSMSQQPSNQQMPGMKFMMLYFMPIFLLCIFNNLSSGLSYYYFLSNLITIIQTWIIRKYVVNEESLLAKMNERAQQPVKKSKFQQRLEEMAKKQQEVQRQKQQGAKRKK